MNTFRNISRTLLFRKAINNRKTNSESLTVTQIYILLCFYLAGGKDGFVSVSKVSSILEKCDRLQNSAEMYVDCAEMQGLGYLIPGKGKVITYKLSVEGMNLLMKIERGGEVGEVG